MCSSECTCDTSESRVIARASLPRRGKRCIAVIGANQLTMMTMTRMPMMVVVVMFDEGVVQKGGTVSSPQHFLYDHQQRCG